MPAPIRVSAAAWATAWLAGGVVLGGLALSAMGADFDAGLTIRELAVAAVLSWAAFAIALAVVSTRAGTGDVLADYAVRIRPVDLLALPAGALAQFVAVPALYWPLQRVWPDMFSDARLEERAIELADRAEASGTVWLLVIVVVVGAPVFEELVYRGLLQRSLVESLGRWRGVLVASAWFSLIHLAPIEYPGLFVAGLVFGVAAVLGDRLGPAMLAHASFNATGLLMAFDVV